MKFFQCSLMFTLFFLFYPFLAIGQQSAASQLIERIYEISLRTPETYNKTFLRNIQLFPNQGFNSCLRSINTRMNQLVPAYRVRCLQRFGTGTESFHTCLNENPHEILANWSRDQIQFLENDIAWTNTPVGTAIIVMKGVLGNTNYQTLLSNTKLPLELSILRNNPCDN